MSLSNRILFDCCITYFKTFFFTFYLFFKTLYYLSFKLWYTFKLEYLKLNYSFLCSVSVSLTEIKAVGTDFTFIFTVLSSYTCPLFLFTHWSKSSGSPLWLANHLYQSFYWLSRTLLHLLQRERARTEDWKFKVNMASKILLRACRVTLLGRQNVLMKTPQRAMAGKGKWHLRIYRFFIEIMIWICSR